ncbi:hypothetical protein RJ640_018371 [Escallonia rubra]|uniref:Uncharacterized protein n=1 Tax=Escallonia rubra TaxID=112253 RepID=A0AA88URZ4_9ASTE|nr:hypothetical protein RJ640_018371 [Escallonia rubra]
MLPQKQAEEAIVSNFSEAEHEGKEEGKEEEDKSFFSVKSILWHGGSVWDAWFSCASNQVHSLQNNLLPTFQDFTMCVLCVMCVY